MPFEVVSFYQFQPLPSRALQSIRQNLLKSGYELRIRGLILLSAEGINATLSGERQDMEQYLQQIQALTGIKNCLYKRFLANKWGFKRLKVKIKRTIITMEKNNRIPGMDFLKQNTLKIYQRMKTLASTFLQQKPAKPQADSSLEDFMLSPGQVQDMLQDSHLAVLDIRNDYEVELGRFQGAQDLNIKEFGEFPLKLQNARLNKNQKTLIYCTGGIRCEKAMREMHRQGFKEVYLLKGGVLHYLKEFPHKNFEGECFVFDQRVALDQEGQPSKKYSLCPGCGQPADQNKKCVQCSKTFRICKKCLKKTPESKLACSKNCAHHLQ